jgi:hypothetical protein
MKQNSLSRSILILGLGFTFSVATCAQQSLGEAARQAKKKKTTEPSKRVITNDDLGAGKPAESGETASSAKPDSGKKSEPDAAKPVDATKASLSADDQAKLDKEWQRKVAVQKEQISMLERELNVLQRENKLRASAYYGDAGSRLRDEKKYAEEDRKYRDTIAAKQKELDDARTKLEAMREEARKAGASVSQ